MTTTYTRYYYKVNNKNNYNDNYDNNDECQCEDMKLRRLVWLQITCTIIAKLFAQTDSTKYQGEILLRE